MCASVSIETYAQNKILVDFVSFLFYVINTFLFINPTAMCFHISSCKRSEY